MAAGLRYLLDTSVYSQPLQRVPLTPALSRWDASGDEVCAVSIVSCAEVEWGLHKVAVSRWWTLYAEVLRPRLQVLPAETGVWTEFARMKAVQHGLGRPVSDLDLLIGATAMVHGLIVATLNDAHFRTIQGLVTEDWSKAKE